jgi:hypothetical protein
LLQTRGTMARIPAVSTALGTVSVRPAGSLVTTLQDPVYARGSRIPKLFQVFYI